VVIAELPAQLVAEAVAVLAHLMAKTVAADLARPTETEAGDE
jgi:hypothetical protein